MKNDTEKFLFKTNAQLGIVLHVCNLRTQRLSLDNSEHNYSNNKASDEGSYPVI